MVVVVVAVAWIALSIPVGLLLGCTIRRADQRALLTDHPTRLPDELTVADILGARAAEPTH
jgi:hypothetical protein